MQFVVAEYSAVESSSVVVSAGFAAGFGLDRNCSAVGESRSEIQYSGLLAANKRC